MNELTEIVNDLKEACISKSSERVKKWRQVTKDRVIAAMGGGCCICGYNKCSNALEMHHLDPTIKEVTLGCIMANPLAWGKIVEELRKCIMVCSNHHREIHAGITDIPLDAPRFDEKYKHKDLKRVSWESCPICKKPKAPYKITCSRKCAAIKARSVQWDDAMIGKMQSEGKSWEDIADYFGVTNGAVRKRRARIQRNNKRKCPFCNSEFNFNNSNQKYCSKKCSRLASRKCIHPSQDQLEEDIANLSWVAIGKKHGVSDKACKKMGD